MTKELTRNEAAALLGVHVWTLDNWIKNGKIQVIRRSRKCVRIEVSALDDFKRRSTVPARAA